VPPPPCDRSEREGAKERRGEGSKEMRYRERERGEEGGHSGNWRGPVPDILVFAKCRGIPESRDLDFR